MAQRMASLRFIPLKISQILSMRGDNSGIEDPYHQSIKNLKPLDIKYFSRILSNAPEIMNKISKIEKTGIPASIGQFHRVLLKDKSTAGLKIQYPSIREMMNQDEKIMNLIHRFFKEMKFGFLLEDYKRVIMTDLSEECDYRKEAKKQIRIYETFKNTSGIIIPQVLDYNEHLLLMKSEDSMDIEEFLANADTAMRIHAQALIADFIFTLFWENSMVYSDLNPGNFGFRIDKKRKISLIVYDFGAVLPVMKAHSLILLKIMQKVDENMAGFLPLYAALGFKTEQISALSAKLGAFSQMLVEPFLSTSRYAFDSWNRKERAKAILGENRWNFMIAAPASLLPVMRMFSGFFFWQSKLNKDTYLRAIYEKYRNLYYNDLNDIDTSDYTIAEKHDDQMASHLKIHIEYTKKKPVHITLPRTMIEKLEHIMDDDLIKKIEKENINIDSLIYKVRENGYKKMDIFFFKNSEKTVRVYLD